MALRAWLPISQAIAFGGNEAYGVPVPFIVVGVANIENGLLPNLGPDRRAEYA